MTRVVRRTLGRQRLDRFRLGVGVALGLVLAVVAGAQHACQANRPGEPTPTAEQVAAPSQAPAAAAPSPKPVDGGTPSSFEIWGAAPGVLYVKYTGTVPAGIETYRTTFDDQTTPLEKQEHTIQPGQTLERKFSVRFCFQGDGDQPGVKELGGIFFDKDGEPFVPSRNPEKVQECRCTPTWVEDEEDAVEYGSWGACTAPQGTGGQAQCSRTRSKTVTTYETETCTNARRVKKVLELFDSEPCECPKACANTPASSSAEQGFSLPNSSEATETAWVDANVLVPPFDLIDKDEFEHEDDCTVVSISHGSSAKVALVKAGTTYRYHLNVHDGQVICSYDPPGSAKAKDISHVSYFGCK